jgi:hypothetical protein
VLCGDPSSRCHRHDRDPGGVSDHNCVAGLGLLLHAIERRAHVGGYEPFLGGALFVGGGPLRGLAPIERDHAARSR